MPEIMYVIIIIFILAILIIYIRGNVLDSRILEYSKKIDLIELLNQRTIFHDIERSITIRKHYDNKGYYNKIEPGYLMSSYVRENISEFSLYINEIKENREKKRVYDHELFDIKSQPHEDIYKELKISRREYLKRERKLIDRIILKPCVSCRISVHMTYSSPKGQVNLYKSDVFSFEDLVVTFDSVSRSYLDKDTFSKLTMVERGEISDSLRYDILNRDDFKCVICGASSREGVRLHVDHIIPVSKGGKSIPDNLRTLCERCNVGKSNKIEDSKNIDTNITSVESDTCPKCGGNLVIRNGKHGEFYGCSNYPKCKFTKNI